MSNWSIAWLVISSPLLALLIMVCVWQRHHIDIMEDRAMPCYEDSVLMWVDAPNEAECIPIDDFIIIYIERLKADAYAHASTR